MRLSPPRQHRQWRSRLVLLRRIHLMRTIENTKKYRGLNRFNRTYEESEKIMYVQLPRWVSAEGTCFIRQSVASLFSTWYSCLNFVFHSTFPNHSIHSSNKNRLSYKISKSDPQTPIRAFQITFTPNTIHDATEKTVVISVHSQPKKHSKKKTWFCVYALFQFVRILKPRFVSSIWLNWVVEILISNIFSLSLLVRTSHLDIRNVYSCILCSKRCLYGNVYIYFHC